MSNTAPIPQYTNNLIAYFKAKFGVSNKSIAGLLNITSVQVKDCLINDTFTPKQTDLVSRLNIIIERMIEESELLQEQSPYLLVLEHEKDMQEMEITRLLASNADLSKEINGYKYMGFFKRLLFLFNIRQG